MTNHPTNEKQSRDSSITEKRVRGEAIASANNYVDPYTRTLIDRS
jgi:hypothetical protein